MKWIVVAVFLATRMHGPNGEFQISDFPTTVSDYFIMAHLLPKWLRIRSAKFAVNRNLKDVVDLNGM